MCATCGCGKSDKKAPGYGKGKSSTAKPKNLSPKQKKIAGKAGNPTKIDSADLAALRKKKK
jgi:hypothetical protein